jgi:hypothetical protein
MQQQVSRQKDTLKINAQDKEISEGRATTSRLTQELSQAIRDRQALAQTSPTSLNCPYCPGYRSDIEHLQSRVVILEESVVSERKLVTRANRENEHLNQAVESAKNEVETLKAAVLGYKDQIVTERTRYNIALEEIQEKLRADRDKWDSKQEEQNASNSLQRDALNADREALQTSRAELDKQRIKLEDVRDHNERVAEQVREGQLLQDRNAVAIREGEVNLIREKNEFEAQVQGAHEAMEREQTVLETTRRQLEHLQQGERIRSASCYTPTATPRKAHSRDPSDYMVTPETTLFMSTPTKPAMYSTPRKPCGQPWLGETSGTYSAPYTQLAQPIFDTPTILYPVRLPSPLLSKSLGEILRRRRLVMGM